MNTQRCLSWLVMFALLPALPAGAQGKLVIENTAHDFGTIEEGHEARHDFIFRNDGDAPLRLTSVQPNCGCTTPSWTRDPVPPGETGSITVVFDSRNRPGTFVKSVRVTTDGEPAQVKLFIEGFVERVRLPGGIAQGNLRFDPEAADLGDIPQGRNALHTFRLQNTGTRPIRIRSATPSHDHVTVEIPAQPIFADDLAEIYVVVKTGHLAAGTDIAYTLTLETDDEIRPQKLLRLTGTITAGDAH
ncbi:MAG: DUF1573 domain-containing protein [Rhodothermales bacterium]